MKDNDSRPPAEDTNPITLSDGNLAEEKLEEAETETETETETEKNDSDDLEPQESWEGEEAEIVADDETEEYEDEFTGIKIKYTLKSEEIYDFIKHSEKTKNKLKWQKKHTVFPVCLLIVMIVLGFLTRNVLFVWFLAFPITALVLVWLIPFLSTKKIANKILNLNGTTVEIFPDKIEITEGENRREILFDGSYRFEEYDGMLIITKNGHLRLILPMRAVEPEFRAEVQAIILAGVKPKEEN